MIINELELLSADLDGTRLFYSEILELKQLPAEENKVAFQAGSTKLIFQQTADNKPCYHFAFAIPHNKILQAYQWLRGKTTILSVQETNPFVQFMDWNAQSFYFFDSNGNILEFICHYDLADSTTELFDTSQILRISEIGIVTEDVVSQAEHLEKAYGLSPFRKQPMRQDFAALGNEEGLLILARPGRNWYPTQQPAEKHYIRLVISPAGPGDGVELVYK